MSTKLITLSAGLVVAVAGLGSGACSRSERVSGDASCVSADRRSSRGTRRRASFQLVSDSARGRAAPRCSRSSPTATGRPCSAEPSKNGGRQGTGERTRGVCRHPSLSSVVLPSPHACRRLGDMEWPLLADLPPEDVRQLLSIARRRTFGRGEVVFHRDDPADSLHLVVRGRFGARVLTPLGDSVLVDVLGPGQSFGELALCCFRTHALGDRRGARGRRDALGVPRRLRASSSASTRA